MPQDRRDSLRSWGISNAISKEGRKEKRLHSEGGEDYQAGRTRKKDGCGIGEGFWNVESILRQERQEMSKYYSLPQLRVFWDDYQQKSVLRVLKDGKWTIQPMKNRGLPHIEGTKAELVPLKQVKSFVDYLEEM